MDNSLGRMLSTAVNKMSLENKFNKKKIVEATGQLSPIPEFSRSTANILASEPKKSSLLRRRNIVTLFMFLAYMVAMILRSNMSIAIVDMTSTRKVNLNNGTEILVSPDFNWTSKECGFVISIFSVGQMVFSVPAGWMASRFGGVRVTGVSTAIAAVLTLLTPIIITHRVIVMIILRFLIGVLQVTITVNMSDVAARWIPPEERARVVGFTVAGTNCGSAFSYVLSGYLAQLWRWPLVFYVTGCMALLWSALWIAFIRENPDQDPWISKDELTYLSEAIKPRKEKIFTSKPVLALSVCRCGNGLDALFLRILIPLYVNDVLRFQVGTTGLLTSIIIVPSIVSMYLTGFLKDYFQNRAILNRKQATFALMSIGTLTSTAMLFVISFIRDPTSIVCILTFIPFFSGMVNVITNVNSLELSSEYASTISGLGSLFFNISQLVGPLYVGEIVTNHETSQWNIVLKTFAALELAGLLIFLTFGTTDTQNFDNEKFENNKSTKSEHISQQSHH